MTFTVARTVPIALAALFVIVLAPSLAWLWSAQPPEPALPAADALAPLRVSRMSAATQPTDDFVTRPLFWESRRPIDIEPAVSPVDVQPESRRPPMDGVLDDARLRGTFSSGGAVGAIVEIGGKSQRLSVGEELRGWQLVEVSEDGAVFEGEAYANFPVPRRQLALEHAFVSPGRGAAGVTPEGAAESGDAGSAVAPAPQGRGVPRGSNGGL